MMVGPVGSFAALGLGWDDVACAVARDPAAYIMYFFFGNGSLILNAI